MIFHVFAVGHTRVVKVECPLLGLLYLLLIQLPVERVLREGDDLTVGGAARLGPDHRLHDSLTHSGLKGVKYVNTKVGALWVYASGRACARVRAGLRALAGGRAPAGPTSSDSGYVRERKISKRK